MPPLLAERATTGQCGEQVVEVKLCDVDGQSLSFATTGVEQEHCQEMQTALVATATDRQCLT